MNCRLYVLIMLFFFICRGAHSQTVSQKMAVRVAENFFQSNSQQQIQIRPLGNKMKPTMYVCSLSDKWVLIAGDQRTQPILAYSDEKNGGFPEEDDMPPAMQCLLDWYNSQIETLRNDSIHKAFDSLWDYSSESLNASLHNRNVVIAPLLSRDGCEAAWGQSGNNNGNNISRSYNKFCPSVSNSSEECEHALVGCVAVAISQVMWYWKWPYATIVNDDNHQPLLRNYNWDIMPSQLTDTSSLSQANMVANLLHDVGVSVNMNYSCSGSGAFPSAIAPAMRNVFMYNTADLIYRTAYTDNIWLNIIKSELDNLAPVLYGGFSDIGGHRFVIDGYSSDDAFHINYGWKGIGNGYFTLNTISFNSNQSMVTNIRPNYPSCTSLTVPPSEVWNTNFVVQNGGGITIGNRDISEGMHGVIFSEEYVKLTSGFKIQSGAEVHIDIKDIHCMEDMINSSAPHIIQNNSHLIPQNTITSSNDNVRKIFQNGHIYIKKGESVYTISGMRIK